MVEGTVLRSHAGGYLVYNSDQDAVFQCAARGRLKKERVSIVTGDRVELDELDSEKKTAVIRARSERQNLLSRPPLANVDQVIIVQAIKQPEWSAMLCDRYIVHFQLELPTALPMLCFNKSDLANNEEIASLRSIYEPLGYSVMIVSAKAGIGIEELGNKLAGKVSVLAGQSGVGKSSILNLLDPSLRLRIGLMENEFGVGRHTTTYSELYKIRVQKPGAEGVVDGWIGDTPGFNILELSHPDPHDVVFQFPEILELAHLCRFTDCLHLVEGGCNVKENIQRISLERYSSYCTIVAEAQNEQKVRKVTSQKVEATVKVVGGAEKGKSIPILSNKYRNTSRRAERQRSHQSLIEDEEDLADDDADEPTSLEEDSV